MKQSWRLLPPPRLRPRVSPGEPPREELGAAERVVPLAATKIHERWSMDFVSDALVQGRKLRIPTLIDSFSRECLAIKVGPSLPARSVADVLDRVMARRGALRTIQVDNGAEVSSSHFDAWAYLDGIAVDFIRPGKPVENAYIESFNGRLRDGCLNSHWFEGLDDARRAIQDWRRDSNDVRPHSALGDVAPSAFAVKLRGLGPGASSQESRNLHPPLDP